MRFRDNTIERQTFGGQRQDQRRPLNDTVGRRVQTRSTQVHFTPRCVARSTALGKRTLTRRRRRHILGTQAVPRLSRQAVRRGCVKCVTTHPTSTKGVSKYPQHTQHLLS